MAADAPCIDARELEYQWRDALIAKDLPFQLPAVHLDMLWHERDARSPAHKWLRMHLEGMNQVAARTAPGTSPKKDTA